MKFRKPIEIVTSNQKCHPNNGIRGWGCSNCMGHTFDHVNFSIYDSNVLVTAEYVKVLEEGESQHRIVAFFSIRLNTAPESQK